MADDKPHQDQMTQADALAAHSQRIRRLRRFLPLIAVALVGLLVLATNFDLFRTPQNSGFGSSGLDVNRLVIDRPIFDGRLPDGRFYRFQAAQGRQQDNGDVVLSMARLAVNANDDKPSLAFAADEAVYENPTNVTDATANVSFNASLSGNVTVNLGDGHELDSPQLALAVDKAIWQAADGIEMRGPTGRLTAAQLTADEVSGVYRFQNIRMRLTRRNRQTGGQ